MNVYEVGAVATTSGQKTVAGLGTAWIANAKAGDVIIIDNRLVAIDEVVDDDTLLLERQWTGPTGSGFSYSLLQIGEGWNSMLDVNVRLARLVERALLGDVPGTPPPDSAVVHLGAGIARGRARASGTPAGIKFGSGIAVGRARATGGSTAGEFDLTGMDGSGLLGMDGSVLVGMDAPNVPSGGQGDALAYVMVDGDGSVLNHMDGELVEAMDAP